MTARRIVVNAIGALLILALFLAGLTVVAVRDYQVPTSVDLRKG